MDNSDNNKPTKLQDRPGIAKKKSVLDRHFNDRAVASKSGFAALASKDAGVSEGYVAQRKEDEQKFMMKAAHDRPKTFQGNIDKRDFVNEYIMAPLYRRMLFDRAPIFELTVQDEIDAKKIGTPKLDSASIIHGRSKFFDEFQTLSEFAGDKQTSAKPYHPNLRTLEGFEKVMAACLLAGELDYHAGNLGVVSKIGDDRKKHNIVVKIDHGRSAMVVSQNEDALISNMIIGLALYGFGNIPFDVKAFKVAIDEMIKISDEEIENIISSRFDILRKSGFKFAGTTFMTMLETFANQTEGRYWKPQLYTVEDDNPESIDKLKKQYIDNFKNQKQVMAKLSLRLDLMAKIDFPTEKFDLVYELKQCIEILRNLDRAGAYSRIEVKKAAIENGVELWNDDDQSLILNNRYPGKSDAEKIELFLSDMTKSLELQLKERGSFENQVKILLNILDNLNSDNNIKTAIEAMGIEMNLHTEDAVVEATTMLNDRYSDTPAGVDKIELFLADLNKTLLNIINKVNPDAYLKEQINQCVPIIESLTASLVGLDPLIAVGIDPEKDLSEEIFRVINEKYFEIQDVDKIELFLADLTKAIDDVLGFQDDLTNLVKIYKDENEANPLKVSYGNALTTLPSEINPLEVYKAVKNKKQNAPHEMESESNPLEIYNNLKITSVNILKEIGSNDPIIYANANKLTIEGHNPYEYAIVNGVSINHQHPLQYFASIYGDKTLEFILAAYGPIKADIVALSFLLEEYEKASIAGKEPEYLAKLEAEFLRIQEILNKDKKVPPLDADSNLGKFLDSASPSVIAEKLTTKNQQPNSIVDDSEMKQELLTSCSFDVLVKILKVAKHLDKSIEKTPTVMHYLNMFVDLMKSSVDREVIDNPMLAAAQEINRVTKSTAVANPGSFQERLESRAASQASEIRRS